MSADETRWHALLGRLALERPGRCLAVMPADHAMAATLRRLPQTQVHQVSLDDGLHVRERWPLAIVAGLRGIEAPAARHLLAHLRDLAAAHTLVLLDPAHDPLDATELRALGFRLLDDSTSPQLFGFDPFDYKDRPEWLNPNNWAHPERWDRERW